jgi:hypothetical protein
VGGVELLDALGGAGRGVELPDEIDDAIGVGVVEIGVEAASFKVAGCWARILDRLEIDSR